jgi:uncharacterized protein YodC (DUF2158 family)
MQHEFQPGDVVQLKSGGPPMTIDEVRTDGTLLCQWFVGSKKFVDVFSSATVAKYVRAASRSTHATFRRGFGGDD